MHPLDAQLMQVGDNLADFPGNLPYDYVAANGWEPDGYLFKSTYATKELLADCERRGFIGGVWFDAHPHASEDLAAYAHVCSEVCTQLGIVSGNLRPVMFDWEKMGALDKQLPFMREWDRLRFARPTVYCVEPDQDGTQNPYGTMLSNNSRYARTRKISTQTYHGGMQPLSVKACMTYLLTRGIRITELNACIDPRAPRGSLASVGAFGCTGSIVFDAERTAPA